jgi:hypothetical protein
LRTLLKTITGAGNFGNLKESELVCRVLRYWPQWPHGISGIVFYTPHTGIMGANPARGMDVRLRWSVPVLPSVGTGLEVGRYPVTGVLPYVYDVRQQSSEIDAIAFV